MSAPEVEGECRNVSVRDGELRFMRFKSALNLVYLAAKPRSEELGYPPKISLPDDYKGTNKVSLRAY